MLQSRVEPTSVQSASAGSKGGFRSRLGVVVALVVALMTFGAVPSGAAAPSAEATTAAAGGRDWLAGRLKTEIPLQVFGSGSWGATLDAAFALASVNISDPLIQTIWNAAVSDREAIVNDGTGDIPGRLSQMILLAYTLDKDPHAVGSAPGNDLVARLEATMTPAGSSDAGLFGAQSPTYDGVYRQGLALAALASASTTPDPLAVDWILDQQCKGDFEGAWMSYRPDTSLPCVSDSMSWVGPDSNASAYAVTGLVESLAGDPEVDDAIDLGLAWFDTDQNSDGGWGGYPWADTDPNSTAVVIQALLATGTESDPRFADQSASPVSALLSFQLGAAFPEEDRGAFTYPGTADSPSEIATVQAVVAAAGFPVVFRPTVSTPEATPSTSTPAPTTTVVNQLVDPEVESRSALAPVDAAATNVRAISLAG